MSTVLCATYPCASSAESRDCVFCARTSAAWVLPTLAFGRGDGGGSAAAVALATLDARGCAVRAGRGLRDLRLRLRERGLGLRELRLKRARIEARQNLAAFHLAVVVDGDRSDRAGDLRADRDEVLRIDGARRRDGRDERRLRHRRGDQIVARVRRAAAPRVSRRRRAEPARARTGAASLAMIEPVPPARPCEAGIVIVDMALHGSEGA